MNFIAELKVVHRILLIGLIVIIALAVPTAMFVDRDLQDIQTARAERDGIPNAIRIAEGFGRFQRYRPLAIQAVRGDLTAEQQSRQLMSELLQGLEPLSRTPSLAGVLTQIQQAMDKASRLRQAGQGRVDALSDAHHQISSLYLQLKDLVLDESGLSLDPEANSYNLMLMANMSLAQTTLYSGELAEQFRELPPGSAIGSESLAAIRMLASVLKESAQSTTALEAKVSGMLTPAQAKTLEGISKQQRDQLSSALSMVGRLTASDRSTGESVTAVATRLNEAIAAQTELSRDANLLLKGILEDRASGSTRVLILSVGVILGLAVLGGLASLTAGRSIVQQLGGEPKQLISFLNEVTKGNLTQDLTQIHAPPGSVMAGVTSMQLQLQTLVTELNQSAHELEGATKDLATGQSELSGRTERQASALEETSASTEELMAAVRQNADNARQASGLTESAKDVVSRGSRQVLDMVQTMNKISGSSSRVVEIISTIDGIAFQTNILALNAAVEAARAGEQGRGFAVVAGEVRSLAQRCSVAAKEIKTLIDDSMFQVNEGAELAQETGQTMTAVVEGVQRVADIMGELLSSGDEQSSGITQVNQAVMDMDQMTQQNAAMVEEMAATSDALADQARKLNELVGHFRVQHA